MATNQSGNNESRSSRSGRGFASMDPARQREIASKGGRAAHQAGTAHKFTSEEARIAGRLGGQASGQSRAAKRQASRGQGAARGAGGQSSQRSDQSDTSRMGSNY